LRTALDVIMTIFLVMLSAIGPGMIFVGLRLRIKARASQSWPQVMGKVANAALMKDGDGMDVEAAVEYDYSVNGVSYKGKRLRFGGWYRRPAFIQADLERYRPGSEVVVFYNPSKPSDAVLLREAKGTLLWILVGILMTVVAVVTWWEHINGVVTDFPD
jgi:hypothetical protein